MSDPETGQNKENNFEFTPDAIEKHERQIKTLELVLEEAEKVGVSEDVRVLGGFVLDTGRPHEDVDILIQGQKSFDKLQKKLLKTDLFAPVGRLDFEGVSRKDLKPKWDSGMEYIDMRWVERSERNGVVFWKYVLPPAYQAVIDNKPLAIPDSAFVKRTIDLGGKKVEANVVAPEFTYLVKEPVPGEVPKAKDSHDRIAMEGHLDWALVEKIKTDAEKAGIEIRIPLHKIGEAQKSVE